MRQRSAVLAISTLLVAMAASGSLGAQTPDDLERRGGPDRVAGSVAGGFEPRSPEDLVQVFIELEEPSVAEFAARTGAGRAAQRTQGRAVLAQQRTVRDRLADAVVEERSNLVVAANGLRAVVRAGDIPEIRATEGVENVAAVAVYSITNETSVPWVGGAAVQTGGFTGSGTSIAIIDTGIDYTHSALGGSGDSGDYESNDPGLVETGTFPTAKVVGGFDFAGPTYDASDPNLDTPSPDGDPLDLNGHGTHVAVTAAGVDALDDVGTGMAPDADLYAFKVFGDVAGSTDLVADAIERALDPNNDLSLEDAVDVINMSLGSPSGHPDDPAAIASQNAADNGVVVVAAAGNSGPLPYVTGSPAVANDVISVAASIDGGVEVLGIDVTFPGSGTERMDAQPGDFGPLEPPGVTGDIAAASPSDACTGIGDVSGEIALIRRGTCTFTTKVRNAQAAGAIGVVVVNDREGPPIAMAHDGTEPRPDIPAVMVGQEDGELIEQGTESGAVSVTISNDILIPKPEWGDNLADFTSRGPGSGNVFKPDVSAPGFNIFSADAGSGTGGVLNSGTSMAAPHVAGAAAQLLDWDPTLTPAQVKALLMNSASRATVEGPAFEAGAVPLARQGTGLVHVDRVVDHLGGYAMPAGLAFHFNPIEETSQTATLEISRLAADATYDVHIEPNQTLSGVTWGTASTVSTSGLTGALDVTVTVDPAALASDDGFYSQAESDAWLVLTNDSDPEDRIVVGLVAVADPASSLAAAAAEGQVEIANGGPGGGFADGFTHLAEGVGSLEAVGFRSTSGGAFDGTQLLELGVALADPWGAPSGLEIDVFLDVDQDGTDDFVLVAADLGSLLDAPPEGVVATAIIARDGSRAELLYFATADMNDRVIILPANLFGDFGFLEEGDTTFDMTTVVFDQLGAAGMSGTTSVDLGEEVRSPTGLSFVVPAGSGGEIATDGQGDMLWLFQNNVAAGQHSVIPIRHTAPPQPPPPPPPPAGHTPSFDDVPETHLFHEEIIWLAEQGITRGCNPPDNTLFCPEDPVTRGQMAAFINRALSLEGTAEDFFVDDGNSIFQGDIHRLAAAGITRGCNPPTNDRFCPRGELTRAQMATFMIRAFEFTDGAGTDLFVDDGHSVHESDIDVLGTAGVTRGCNPPTNDRFCPDDDMTRGQMAAFIFRAFQAAGLAGPP